MISDLQLEHIYKYGNHLAEILKEKGILNGYAYLSIHTFNGEKALCFTHYPNGEPKNLGFIYINDLLNAETNFRDKLLCDFSFYFGS